MKKILSMLLTICLIFPTNTVVRAELALEPALLPLTVQVGSANIWFETVPDPPCAFFGEIRDKDDNVLVPKTKLNQCDGVNHSDSHELKVEYNLTASKDVLGLEPQILARLSAKTVKLTAISGKIRVDAYGDDELWERAYSHKTSVQITSMSFLVTWADDTQETISFSSIYVNRAGTALNEVQTASTLSNIDSHYAPRITGVTPEKVVTYGKGQNNHSKLTNAITAVEYQIGESTNLAKDLTAQTGKTNQQININSTSFAATLLDGKLEPEAGTVLPMNSGGLWVGVGIGQQNGKITDGHNDSTTFTRGIVVRTTDNPEVEIYYDGTGDRYGGEWLSTDTSADVDRQRSLDIYTETAVPGDYNATIYKDSILDGGSKQPVTGKTTTGTDKILNIAGYTSGDTSAAGIAFTGVLLPLDVDSPLLSSVSGAKYVKFDSTPPTIGTVTDISSEGDWSDIDIPVTDGGASDVHKAYFMWVPSDGNVPSVGDMGWKEHGDFDLPGAGKWNLYVYADDNATNKSDVELANISGPIIVSALKPVMSGKEAVSGDVIASGDWANETLNVTTTKPEDPLAELPILNYIKVTSPVDAATTPNVAAVDEKTTGAEAFLTVPYAEETDGIKVTGVIINDLNANITQKETYTVRIDKTAPTAAGSVSQGLGNSFTFVDAGSTENVAVNGATGSGIASGTTKFVAVPVGDAAPTDYDDYTIGEETKDLSSLGAGTYDVYVKVKDVAGNISAPELASGGPIVIKNDDASKKPTLIGKYSALSGNNDAANSAYTSGDWSNVPIDLTGSKAGIAYTGAHNVDISDGASAVATGTGDAGGDVTHSATTEGITSYSALVVNTNTPTKDALSLASDALVVKIDTLAPTSDLASTDNWTTITDNSADDITATTDVSDIYKTYVKYVPANTGAPTTADTGWIDASTPGASLTSAGVWDVYSYTIDNAGNKSAVVNEDNDVEVASSVKPLISAVYTSGATDKDGVLISDNTPYDGLWTNDGVDITVATTDIASGLYGALYEGASAVAFDSGAISLLKYVSVGYDTGSANNAGTDITGKIASNATLSVLSQASDVLNVKVDKAAPLTAITIAANGKTFGDASIDVLSGVYKTMLAYVPVGDTPVAGAYAEISTVNISTPGEYDVWAYTIDNAGNQSTKAKQNTTPVQVISNAEAKIRVTYDDNGTDKPYTSGAWTNKDVTITVSQPDSFDYVGYYNSALKYNVTGNLGVGTDNAGGDYAYTVPGTVFNETVYGIMVNSAGTPISAASGDVVVKVDKVLPIAQADFVAASCEIVDQSTDANSGIDSTKTKVAIVVHGSAAPVVGDFSAFSSGMTIPQDGGYYDVYMIATDIAGNESAITKVLNNRSSNPKDKINASDFERGVNEGPLVDADARALADVSGEYYTILPPAPIAVNDILVDGTLLADINTNIAGSVLGKNDLTFKTPAGIYQEQADIKVTVYKHGDSGTPGSERIYGNDFIYAVNQGSIDEARAKNLAAIFARENDLSVMELSKVVVDPTELADINTAIAESDVDNNTWPLTFTTPGGQSVTVEVSLFDNVGPNPPVAGVETIAANDFNFGMDQGDLTAAMAKDLAKVYAEDEFGVEIPAGSLAVEQADLDAINAAIAAGDKSGNPFDLTFTAPGGTSVTAKVTLFDHINPPAAGQAKIVANDIHYGIDKGNMDDDLAKLLSQVAAINANGKKIDVNDIDVDAADLQAINDAIDAKENGTYPLTFTEPSGEEVTIAVKLYDNNGIVPPAPGVEAIYGNDFSYGISSGVLNAADAKILADVYAHDNKGVAIAVASLDVKASDLAALNAAIAAKDKSGNPFDLTFISPGGKETTVKVTLKDNGPQGPVVGGKEYITGDNFSYGLDQGALTEGVAELLASLDPRKADGTAMDLSDVTADGAELAAINTAITNQDKSGNPFDLTFTTVGGESVTVKVTLYDHINPVQPGKATIVGNDFIYGIAQGAMDDGLARIYANVKAKDKDGVDILATDIDVDATELAAINTAIANKDKSGNPFTLTFTEASGEKVSVLVTLKDNGNGPEDEDNNSERIAADNFFYGISEGALTATQAKALANVVAFEENGKVMDLSKVSVKASELAAINAAIVANDKSGNPFPLTFTTPDGTDVTVDVTLKDIASGVEDPGNPGNNTDRIGADDFFYGIDQGPIAPDDAKLFAEVEAVDKDGNPIELSNITTDQADLADINDAIAGGKLGEYPLKFITPDGTEVEVTVTLKSHGDGEVQPAATDRITANDFIYGVDEGDITALEAKIRSQVEAVDANGKDIKMADIITDVAQLKAINDAIADGKTGDFPLTYKTAGGTQATVNVALKSHAVEPNIDPHNPEKTTSGNIGANDFIVGASEKTPLTNDEARLRSRVIAKDAFGNDYPLSSISVNAAELKAINDAKAAGQTGKLPLTFTSLEGKSVTVKVSVHNVIHPPLIDPVIPGKNESSIGANHFNYGVNEGALTADKAKELADVIAKDKDGHHILAGQIKVDQAQLDKINNAVKNGETGKLPLTFTEPDGKKVTIDVDIYDNVIHNPDLDNGQEIGGNDFKHDVQDGKITEDKAKELSEVYAKDKLGLNIPADQIHVNKGDLDKLNDAIANGETGEFELKFTTDDGQELTVTVNIFDGKPADDVTPTPTPKPDETPKPTKEPKVTAAPTPAGNNGATNNGNIIARSGTTTYMSPKGARGAKTGDMTTIGLWLALALAASGTLVVVVARRKKRQ